MVAEMCILGYPSPVLDIITLSCHIAVSLYLADVCTALLELELSVRRVSIRRTEEVQLEWAVDTEWMTPEDMRHDALMRIKYMALYFTDMM